MSYMDINAVVTAIKSCLPETTESIALHEPRFSGREWEYVKECLDTGWVSSAGKYVERFEQQLAEVTGAQRAVAVVNGTAALHICLKLVGVEPGDEVIVPALTFVATANAVTYCGAVPHFVDSEERTLGIDPYKLDSYLREITDLKGDGSYNKHTGRRIKAVVPMHTFGHPVDLDPLVELCHRYQLELVEDAAEALGSYYKGRHTGNWGKMSALSFNGNKIVTTGGGGAILTNDEELGKLAKHITTTAKLPHKWAFYHDLIGYNYRMPNINAALGCAQLEQLPDFLAGKRRLAERYRSALMPLAEVTFYNESDFARSNYWLNVMLLESGDLNQRNSLLEALHVNGIKARPVWTLMSQMPMFKHCPGMELDVAESLERSIINIPSSAFL